MRKHPFTLVELLAAIAVLLILMGILFKFIAGSQTIWRSTEANSRIYEKAQVLFEVMGRDIESAVANDFPGSEVPFFLSPKAVNPPSPITWSDRDMLCAVTTMPEPNSDATTDLAEVKYMFFTDDTDTTHADKLYQIRRVITADTTGTGPNPQWNFHRIRTGTNNNWIDDNGQEHVLIDGVKALQIIAHPGLTNTVNKLPVGVQITVTLFDPTAPTDELKDLSERTFSKWIMLNR